MLLPPLLSLFVSLITLLSSVGAAVPDKDAILAQLRRNGLCCASLSYFLPGKVNYVADLNYQSSQASFWSAQERSLSPTCIVIPTRAQDVATAVAILSAAKQASIKGCQFAIRGAGHTPHGGAANINGGVTIDLQSLNEVTVSGDQKIVSVGPGNRWGNIYPTLDGLDLIMLGGRVSTVGVGGLMTGGGVSFFSGRYGFACDNVASYEVVLANGTIVTASSNSHPTLFRALKGGNNNFGIITRVNSKLYHQSSFWGGAIIQPITNKEAFFEYFSNLTDSRNFDPNAALITNFAWVAGVPIITHSIAYTDGDVAWPPPAFEPLDSMPKFSSTVRKDKLSSFTNELAASAATTTGGNNFFMTLTFENNPEITPEFLQEVFNLADAAAKELISVVGIIYTATLQPLPHVLYSKPANNVLGLDRFSADLINLLITLSWQLPLDNARVTTVMKKLESDLVAKAKERDLFNEFIYLNYAAEWQKPIQGYGNANVEFLKSVSRRYDPNAIFQRAVPGGFKLGI
ncbi:putative oxidoreductase [Amniculicola lignicola CBS 123094]|uniref:Putative oxidoreductase n=1 Tax=Amniculicola lignicola CBS 123094 TaxID=1392246 RepID=A0A6A5WMZ6_9PLEO|nr:putative oxidoreductase [Amniculicola lignicola CBS 123094]